MSKDCIWESLFPFGKSMDVDGQSLDQFNIQELAQEILVSKLVLIRNMPSPSDLGLIEFAESFKSVGYRGVLDWNGEKLFHLRQDLSKENYIFSNENVPLHWDGAFHTEPSFLVFYCDEASGEGGETIFSDTTQVFRRLHEEIDLKDIRLEIETDKKVHYGGKRDLAILSEHPHTHQPILRLAESVDTHRNPVKVKYYSTSSEQLDSSEIEKRLILNCYDSSVLLNHQWKTGDLLLVDNHALVHGRKSFNESANRHIRRVQIL